MKKKYIYIKHSKLYGFDPCFGRNLFHCVLCAIFNGSRHSSVIFHLLIYVVARNKEKERKKSKKYNIYVSRKGISSFI